jgi:hypothetical protein
MVTMAKTPIPAGAVNWSPVGSDWENFLAGAGKAFVDPYTRVKQLTGNATQEEIDAQAQRDKPLMNTKAGLGGNILGQVAGTAPLAGGLGLAARAIPAARATMAARPLLSTLGASTGVGAAQGAAQPVQSGETAIGNIAGGGEAGLIGGGLGAGISALVRPAIAAAKPAIAALAKRAEDFGFPLSSSQVSGSKLGHLAEKWFGNMPFGGAAAQGKAQTANLTRKMTGTFGPESEDASRAVGQAKKTLGQGFDAISGRNNLRFTQGDYDTLDAIPLDHVSSTGDMAEGNRLLKVIESIKEQYRANGSIPGTDYQSLRSTMGKNALGAPKGGVMQESWNKVQGTLDDAMRRSIGPDEAAAWDDLRGKWSNMKTVERMLPAAGEAGTTGQLDPSKAMRVMTSPNKLNAPNANAMQAPLGASGSDLADLTQIGNAFVPKPDASSGLHIPFGDIAKSLGPTGGNLAASAALGYGASHFMPEESELHKNPLLAIGLTTAGGSLAGSTVGRALLSQAFRRGSPALTKAAEALAPYKLPAASLSAAKNAANEANPTIKESPAQVSSRLEDLTAGLKEVQPEDLPEGLQSSPK